MYFDDEESQEKEIPETGEEEYFGDDLASEDEFDTTQVSEREQPDSERENIGGLEQDGIVEVAGDEEDGFSTEDQEEQHTFEAKADVNDVFRQKKGGLDKNRIIGCIVIFVSVFMVVATISLFKGDKRKEEVAKKKKEPAQNVMANYENMAELIEQGELGNYETENTESDESVESEDEEIPAVPQLSEKRYLTESSSSSGTVGKPRPDTSANKLQARSISGIKGLTDTQRTGSSNTAERTEHTNGQNNAYAQFGMPDKSEYMQQMLSMYGQQNGSSYTLQNGQQQKNDFYNKGRENAGMGQWLPVNTVLMGTIFTVELMNNINTDLPGSVSGRVTKNIYSADGQYILIPQGSIVLGNYNSSISYAQSRVQVAWNTLIRPDLYQINLGNMEGTDVQGAAGLKGWINDHPLEYVKAFALMSFVNLINIEFKNQIGAYDNNEYVQNILADAQSVMNQMGTKIVDRAMDIQPTISIKAGTIINVVVNTNLTLPVLEPYPVEQPYRRIK